MLSSCFYIIAITNVIAFLLEDHYEKIELLAPAGDRESFIAAVQNGADAIYLGGTLFSARANAKILMTKIYNGLFHMLIYMELKFMSR